MELVFALLVALMALFEWIMGVIIIACLIIYALLFILAFGCLIYYISGKLAKWKSRKEVK